MYFRFYRLDEAEIVSSFQPFNQADQHMAMLVIIHDDDLLFRQHFHTLVKNKPQRLFQAMQNITGDNQIISPG